MLKTHDVMPLHAQRLYSDIHLWHVNVSAGLMRNSVHLCSSLLSVELQSSSGRRLLMTAGVDVQNLNDLKSESETRLQVIQNLELTFQIA
jgi:hypothetical protein